MRRSFSFLKIPVAYPSDSQLLRIWRNEVDRYPSAQVCIPKTVFNDLHEKMVHCHVPFSELRVSMAFSIWIMSPGIRGESMITPNPNPRHQEIWKDESICPRTCSTICVQFSPGFGFQQRTPRCMFNVLCSHICHAESADDGFFLRYCCRTSSRFNVGFLPLDLQ